MSTVRTLNNSKIISIEEAKEASTDLACFKLLSKMGELSNNNRELIKANLKYEAAIFDFLTAFHHKNKSLNNINSSFLKPLKNKLAFQDLLLRIIKNLSEENKMAALDFYALCFEQAIKIQLNSSYLRDDIEEKNASKNNIYSPTFWSAPVVLMPTLENSATLNMYDDENSLFKTHSKS